MIDYSDYAGFTISRLVKMLLLWIDLEIIGRIG